MSTVIYSSPIFGPVHSRRLGVSLGINLMPSDGKICTFDCLYCECGLNSERHPHLSRPTRQQVADALEERLRQMKAVGPEPNVFTFAGNGEPTAHPEFAGIVDDTIRLRDKYFPQVNIAVLSNATRIRDKKVFDALLKVDHNFQKLDTVNLDYIKFLDRPVGHYDLDETIETLKAFNGKVFIQSMFLTGSVNGRNVDNTGEEYVRPWIEKLKYIAPAKVWVYTVDRETPVSGLCKASRDTLDGIVARLEAEGIRAEASY